MQTPPEIRWNSDDPRELVLCVGFSLRKKPDWFGWTQRANVTLPAPMEEIDEVTVTFWKGNPLDACPTAWEGTVRPRFSRLLSGEESPQSSAPTAFWSGPVSGIRRIWSWCLGACSSACRFWRRPGSHTPPT